MCKELFQFYVEFARSHKDDEKPSDILIDIFERALKESEEYGDCDERKELAKILYTLVKRKERLEENK